MNAVAIFPYIAGVALGSWGVGLACLPRLPRLGRIALLLGALTLLGFLGVIWVHMERPPLRTLGETRLWYAAMLPLVAWLIGWRWRMTWPLFYAVPLAGLFLLITWQHPESWDKTLMPALQSPWFVPHVLAYLLAYAFLSASFVASLRGFFQPTGAEAAMRLADASVRIGFALLTLGLVIGAVWAKEAWGHYWTWDPKETWALLTWLAYLGYLHFRLYQPLARRTAFAFLAIGFVVLLLCWFGLNYLPIASASVHTYTQ